MIEYNQFKHKIKYMHLILAYIHSHYFQKCLQKVQDSDL